MKHRTTFTERVILASHVHLYFNRFPCHFQVIMRIALGLPGKTRDIYVQMNYGDLENYRYLMQFAIGNEELPIYQQLGQKIADAFSEKEVFTPTFLDDVRKAVNQWALSLSVANPYKKQRVKVEDSDNFIPTKQHLAKKYKNLCTVEADMLDKYERMPDTPRKNLYAEKMKTVLAEMKAEIDKIEAYIKEHGEAV